MIQFHFLLSGLQAKMQNYQFIYFSLSQANTCGIFTNSGSFVSLSCKSSLLHTLSFRAFTLCSGFELFPSINNENKRYQNLYWKVLRKCSHWREIYALTSEKEVICVLPFTSRKPLRIVKIGKIEICTQNLLFCELIVAF